MLICFNSNKLLQNCEYEQKFISAKEIINYATNLLAYSNDNDIVKLAILYEHEEDEIARMLNHLSDKENCQYSHEFRKFRVLYIKEHLPKKGDYFMHGIIKISELWNKFEFPDDSPNIYFKFKDYSEAKFNELLKIHAEWIDMEIEKVKQYPCMCSDTADIAGE